jgi:colanic acid/amylovoran biosynthesis protein
MRVLVLWADDASPNLGVRALGRGTAALVRSVWPDAEIEFQNYGHRSEHLPFGRIRSLAKERVTGRLGMQRWLAGFDLVVDTRSGDSFADIYGLHRLAVMSTVADLARQARVPVVLGPQTIGPFSTVTGKAIARTSMRRADMVMARDTASARHAEELGHPVDVLTTDVVFALPVPTVTRSRDVVLNVSGLLWNENSHVPAGEYRRVVERLHHTLIAQGRTVSLLAHVLDSPNADNDVTAIRDFARMVAPDAEVLVPDGLDEVREIVASAQVVIGSRMHACLNALSVGTPAVPLAYSRKFASLLGDLGWDHTVDLRDDSRDPVPLVLRAMRTTGTEEVARLTANAHGSLSTARAALAALPAR